MTIRDRYKFRKFIKEYYNDKLSMSDNYLIYRLLTEHYHITTYSMTTYRVECLRIKGVMEDKYINQLNKLQQWENWTK